VARQRWHGKWLTLDWVRAVHNHKLVRNCINWSDGRNRKDLRLGGFSDLSVLSFIENARSMNSARILEVLRPVAELFDEPVHFSAKNVTGKWVHKVISGLPTPTTQTSANG
jgi:hypothetical protein